MWRTDAPAPEEADASDAARAGSGSGGGLGAAAVRLVAYGGITVAVTLILMRPERGGPAAATPFSRGSTYLGPGPLAALGKALLGGGETTGVAAAVPATCPAEAQPAKVAPAAPPAASATRPAAPESSKQAVEAPAPRVEVAVAPQAPAAAPSPIEAATPREVAGEPRTSGGPAVETEHAPKLPEQVAKATPPAPARPQAAAAKPAAKPAEKPEAPKTVVAAGKLGPKFLDDVNGFSMHFPAGWSHRRFAGGGSWIVHATDGKAAVISIGYTAFPENLTADRVDTARIARGIRRRAGTVVHAEGRGVIAGRRCVWHKYTGPVSRPGGRSRLTVVHYLLPLQDGRALEVRVAAAPSQFQEMAPQMKQSLQTLRVMAPQARAR